MADINGIPYVEATDLVSAYPGTSLALATELDTQLAAKLAEAGGKILQIVRETDTTNRSTTSTSFVDVTGMSVTITPQKSDSAIIIIVSCQVQQPNSAGAITISRITDASDNAISGAESSNFGVAVGTSMTGSQIFWAYNTPATTSATTYKMRFSVNTGTGSIRNDSVTGQIYAIEVSA